MPAFAGFSSATLVTEYSNGTGTHWNIDDTGNLLFEPTSPYTPTGPGAGLWDQNNMSPVDYPNVSPPYVPSPGTYGAYEFAEHTDIEGLFYDYECATGELRVWVTTSIGPNGFSYSGYPYHLGDVFVNTDADAAYEMALLSFGTKPGLSANHSVNGDNLNPSWKTTNSRSAGSLALIGSDSVLYGINGPASWSGNSTIRGLVNPWAVNNANVIAAGDLLYDEITGHEVNERDFAGGPGVNYWPAGTHSTFLYLWDVIIPDAYRTGLAEDDFSFHVTVQCGNDVLNGGTPVAPLPGAAMLVVMGFAGVTLIRRRL